MHAHNKKTRPKCALRQCRGAGPSSQDIHLPQARRLHAYKIMRDDCAITNKTTEGKSEPCVIRTA
jgi:hypothetical protein